MVAETRVGGIAPMPRGGSVVSGVYHRTSTVIYTGPGGATGASGRWAQQTLRVTTTSSSRSCALVTQADLGANSFPVHLWVANGHVYWVSESGSSRLIQTCPSTGCGSGYPKTVFNGTALDGVPVSGLVVNATDAYVLSYVGGVYRIPLTSVETSDATAAVRTVGTGYGSGGFEGDASLLRWANINTGTLESCVLPDCTRVDTPVSGLLTPVGIRSNATHVYGASRGTPEGSNRYVAGTATIWRVRR
jgi:hypothetical protein